MAGWISHWTAIGFALATLPASAQIVVKTPTFEYPELPPVAAVEEKEPEPTAPPVPTYEGPHISLATTCEIERLQYAGIRCSADQPCEFFLELVSVAAERDWVVLAGEIHTAPFFEQEAGDDMIYFANDQGDIYKIRDDGTSAT